MDTVVTLEVTVAGDTAIDTKDGEDAVLVLESELQKFDIKTGDDNDFFYVSETSFGGKFDADLYKGDDTAVLANNNIFGVDFKADGDGHEVGDAFKDDGTNTFAGKAEVKNFELFDVPQPVIDARLDEGLDQLKEVKNSLFSFIACPFHGESLDVWTATEHGGSDQGRGSVEIAGCTVTLREGDSFLVGFSTDFTVPDTPAAIQFTYEALSFDTADPDFINDAFEFAVVDSSGNPLVQNFVPGRDAQFNITEGEAPQFREGIVVDGQTITIGLGGVPAGTEATMTFRLVNDDVDTRTEVTIIQAELIESDLQAAAAQDIGEAERLLRETRLAVPPTIGAGAGAPELRGIAQSEAFASLGGDPTGGTSPTLITDPNDPRAFLGATVGTFAALFFGGDTPEIRQRVIDEELLDAGLFDIAGTRPATLIGGQ